MSTQSRRDFLKLLAGAVVIATCAIPKRAFAAGGLVLIVHAKNGASLDLDTVKRIYVGDMAYWSGSVAAHPLTRVTDSPAGTAFFQKIQIAPSRFRRIWQEKQLSGQGSVPDVVADPAMLVARIAADIGAIGFAMSDELPASHAGVRVLPFD